MSVKTFVSTFALSLALLAVTTASAQYRGTGSSSAADSVLLSETTDGNYLVRRYMIHNQSDAGYTVRYQINLAQLAPALDNNSHQLDRLGGFVDQLMRDTLMHVKRVTLTGYSSPDGPVAFNEQLAAKRARDFKNYVDRKYNFSQHYDVTLNSVAEDWEMCRALVAQSDIPNKQAVLDVIDSSRAVEAKEQALKQMPAAWNYMKKNILPPLRRVELAIDYGEGNIVEVRTLLPQVEEVIVTETVVERPCCCPVDDGVSGMLVELPGPGRDFDEYADLLRRDIRDLERDLRHIDRRADRFDREEDRTLERLDRREHRDREALRRDKRDPHRKKGRVGRRMHRAEDRAADRTYRDLERALR